jgi:hypothetical protein
MHESEKGAYLTTENAKNTKTRAFKFNPHHPEGDTPLHA